MFVLKLQKLLQTKNKEVRETGLLSCIILKTKLASLVIMDIMMPQLDGIETCRRMRERHSVPILFLSAKSEELDKLEGMAPAAAAAEREKAAASAFCVDGSGLLDEAERFPPRADRLEAVRAEIAEPVRVEHVKIAGIYPSVAFDDPLTAALSLQSTDLRVPSQQHVN